MQKWKKKCSVPAQKFFFSSGFKASTLLALYSLRWLMLRMQLHTLSLFFGFFVNKRVSLGNIGSHSTCFCCFLFLLHNKHFYPGCLLKPLTASSKKIVLMKQEFPTLVRVFDQTKIKKSYNLFRNLLKQAVMSDTNPEKLKSVIYPFFLPQQSCFKRATEVNKLTRDVSWKGKLVQNRHNNQKVFGPNLS